MAAEEEDSCSWYDAACHAGDFLGNIADSAIGEFIESIHSAAIVVLDMIGTWWMGVGGPDFESSAVSGLQENLRYFVWVFAVIGFMLALGKMALTQDARQGTISIGGQLFRIILASGVYMTAVPLLLEAGDETATWLLEQANESQAEVSFSGLAGSSAALMSMSGAAFLIYVLIFIGAVVNFIFMLFRNVMFLVLMVFIVVIAASSSTEAGQTAWRKANGWLLALLLFKPVAAAIYALGFRLMRDSSGEEGNDAIVDGFVSGLTGLLVIVLAALALPALIKFVVPVAAAGAGAFSGGAVLGATAGVAAGAAVVASTGGAAAAGSGGGAAATTGAASAGGTGTGGTSSGGNTGATANGAGNAPSTEPSVKGALPAGGASGSDSGSNSGSGSDSGSTTHGTGSSSTSGSQPSASAAASSGTTTLQHDSGSDSATTSSGATTASQDTGAAATASGNKGQRDWAGAYQAYHVASGAMGPQQNDEEDQP